MGDYQIPSLYQRHFVEKQDERKHLFMLLVEKYRPSKGLYPGSFVHVTPSLFIHDMTYIDMDKRIVKFFEDKNLMYFLEKGKIYSESPIVTWLQADYSQPLPIEENSFDILFSFYAGFISQACKKYLKPQGILICNNSHGDSTLAYVDNDYTLEGVINRRGEKFTISEKDIHSYFVKKDGTAINKERVLEKMIGENYSRKGFAYIFRYLPS